MGRGPILERGRQLPVHRRRDDLRAMAAAIDMALSITFRIKEEGNDIQHVL